MASSYNPILIRSTMDNPDYYFEALDIVNTNMVMIKETLDDIMEYLELVSSLVPQIINATLNVPDSVYASWGKLNTNMGDIEDDLAAICVEAGLSSTFSAVLVNHTTSVIDCGLSDSYMTFTIDCETAYLPGTDIQGEPSFIYDFGVSSTSGRDTLLSFVIKTNGNLQNIKSSLDLIADAI